MALQEIVGIDRILWYVSGKTRTLDELERSLNLAQWHKIGEKLRDLK